jgi:DNA invertase Pin-like site-specific DNA recombinase
MDSCAILRALCGVGERVMTDDGPQRFVLLNRLVSRSVTCAPEEHKAPMVPGAELIAITRVDRLARSIGDLQDIVHSLKAKGASLRATEQPIDTSTAAGKCFLDMLGVFAEFETNLRRERQLEGIAKAKAAGVYTSRKPSIDVAQIAQLKDKGLGATEIANRLKIGRASVYRVVGRATS